MRFLVSIGLVRASGWLCMEYKYQLESDKIKQSTIVQLPYAYVYWSIYTHKESSYATRKSKDEFEGDKDNTIECISAYDGFRNGWFVCV